jgi:hypothetical protein
MTFTPSSELLQKTIQDVFGAFLSPVVERKVKVTAWPWLRVRAGAGTSYASVKWLLPGTVVQIGEVQVASGEQWGRLTDGSGWIAMRWTVEA